MLDTERIRWANVTIVAGVFTDTIHPLFGVRTSGTWILAASVDPYLWIWTSWFDRNWNWLGHWLTDWDWNWIWLRRWSDWFADRCYSWCTCIWFRWRTCFWFCWRICFCFNRCFSRLFDWSRCWLLTITWLTICVGYIDDKFIFKAHSIPNMALHLNGFNAAGGNVLYFVDISSLVAVPVHVSWKAIFVLYFTVIEKFHEV